ncbi:MAG TPA: 2-phospho-L-lactate guanylyltransferase [Azospirillum sp.]|nr:2-phospho-L-lactate guanylyltransferase [Azospirillum sp.]
MIRRDPLWALVPVRSLEDGKRRLSPFLAPEERAALVRSMLEDGLDALHRCAAVDTVAVVTGDAAAAEVAAEYGAVLLPEAPEAGLNRSLEGARAWLLSSYPRAHVLMLPADLPGVTPAELETTVLAADADVVLARSTDGGTNAMFLRPIASLPFGFGLDSCQRHREAAVTAGRSVQVVDSPGLALDIDHPADLAAYLKRGGSSRTLGLLHRLRIADRLKVAAAP